MRALANPSQEEIVIYQAPDGSVELNVWLEKDTLWLSQKQMALIFEKDPDTIGLHLRNIYKEGELDEAATTEESSVVQTEGKRRVRRNIRIYNLDAIISVGYRVNSKRGTQLHIWATRVLRNHILEGYTVNEQRLRHLNQAVKLIADTAVRRDLSGDEAKALLAIVGDYRRALGLLDDYDHQRVSTPDASGKVLYPLEYKEALRIVERLRSEFAESAVFGVEKDKGLASALGAIMQTAGGAEVYPSLEENGQSFIFLGQESRLCGW